MLLLVCSNKDGNIKIKLNEIDKVIKGRESGKPTIFENGIVLNWNMYAGVVEDKFSKEEISELVKLGRTIEEARKEVEGKSSMFAKLLSDKMRMLSPEVRTIAQEEAAREERRRFDK
jgi:hypothetical protein